MDTKIADLGSCKKEVTVTIPAERVDQEINHAYESLKGQVALPGFRQGKVPLAMLEKRFGDGMAKDVASKVVESALGEVLREHKLEIVDRTRTPLRDVGRRTRQAAQLHRPHRSEARVRSPTYKGARSRTRREAVEDADVAKVVDDLRKSKGTFKASAGAFEKGDRVTGSVKAVLDGAVVWSADAMNVDGKTHEFGPYHVHGIEGVLEGRKAGDTVSLEGHGADRRDEGSHARPVDDRHHDRGSGEGRTGAARRLLREAVQSGIDRAPSTPTFASVSKSAATVRRIRKST
jgi:trigger factor